ncbi:MAG TPA: SurA N-terminal domain-containing protein, partial [bacterium]
MSFRSKSLFSYAVLGVIFFVAGIACDKFSNNPSGVSNSQVVATVNGHDITFGDWMKQVDMTRVFVTPIDPSNVEQVKAVLNSLIDQQLVLDAAQKDHYSDPKFDDAIKKKLLEADLTVKEVRDRLEKDRQTLNRLEKNYQEPYKRMLLAHEYAASRLDTVEVTEKDLRDWYTNYSAQAARSGQSLPPYEKVKDRV